MDISQVIARAYIPQPEAALLKAGDQATVIVPGEDNPIEGKITVVSPALDPSSTTVEVWVQIKNIDQRLKPEPACSFRCWRRLFRMPWSFPSWRC